jgi:homoserine kinase
MKNKKVYVSVPASSGNIGPGFDVLGLALNLRNELKVRVVNPRPGNSYIQIKGEGEGHLPTNSSNLVYRAIKAVYQKAGRRVPQLDMVCINRIPLARGLGSSSAACLSGLLAGNRLLKNRFSDEELLAMANKFEGHPDNVVSALYGGVRASCVYEGRVISARWPVPKTKFVVVIPKFQLSTQKARQALPTWVSMKDAISNLSSVALMPEAFKGRVGLLKVILNDKWHEPYRARLIPGFLEVKKAALQAGGLGVILSGAGPTVVCFAGASKAKRVGMAMQKQFKRKGIQSEQMVLNIDRKGAVVR